MKILNFIALLIIVLTLPFSYARAGEIKATSQEKQAKLAPKDVLLMLKNGNQRFLSEKMRNLNYRKEMKVTAKRGQFPKAIIFNCIDSRSIAEILFDQGLGNIFVSRIAGNVAGEDVIGGMEFATQLAGASLIVVMGHTHCGAVQGACKGGGEGDLGALLSKIKPAISQLEVKNKHELNCNKVTVIDEIARQNVLNQMQRIKKSSVIVKLLKSNQVEVVGAMHDINTGKVHFFDAEGQAL